MGEENKCGNLRKGEKDTMRGRKLRQSVIGERVREKRKDTIKEKRLRQPEKEKMEGEKADIKEKKTTKMKALSQRKKEMPQVFEGSTRTSRTIFKGRHFVFKRREKFLSWCMWSVCQLNNPILLNQVQF